MAIGFHQIVIRAAFGVSKDRAFDVFEVPSVEGEWDRFEDGPGFYWMPCDENKNPLGDAVGPYQSASKAYDTAINCARFGTRGESAFDKKCWKTPAPARAAAAGYFGD